ncbi:DUF3237 domain-containing protein [Curtobacterium sp. MCBD17_034]|uniref:DUF3237 domain-containing protein n=1 Tax=unclassified Curtobacterium TaxID=257496 RepID=UPI000DA80A2B|nr:MULTISPECIES: DUF3237 domain-containing protein [unclassified Curtobacterium]PZF62617.1 DUF3237 domain-containing protein [Curtobacterium sp. MCBD17_034]PZM34115.1 DUF3237 domain-containing protein [Curtobacterium sp. MCBD17_031]
MQTEHEFTITVQVGEPGDIGAGPGGLRRFIPAASGTVTGDRIRGRLRTGGGDWLLAGPDGFATTDMRYVLETEDGALIYLQGRGVVEMNDAMQRALGEGVPTEFADHYVRTTFVLETGDERYAWVNRTVFLSQTRFTPGPAVEYSVERVL